MLMLLFYVGKNCYCCTCDFIIEIVPKIPLKEVPLAPSPIAGMLNYAGEPVPVIDFSMIIDHRPSKKSMHTRIMLFKNPLEGRIKNLGLIAEKITETRDIDPLSFSELGLELKNLSFLNGIYNTEHESIQRVYVDQIFLSFQDHIL